MSAKAVFWALEQRHLKPTDKLVLIVLANFANENNECWPSYQRIARDAVISRRTAIEILKRLESLGVVAFKQRRNDEGRQNSNVFKLQISATVKQIKPISQSAESSPIEESENSAEEENAPVEKKPVSREQINNSSVSAAQIQSADYGASLVSNPHPSVLPASPEPNNESKNFSGVEEFVTKTGSHEQSEERPTDDRKFRMPNNWQPLKEFKAHAEKHGVKNIDELDLDDFRLHWSEERHQRTQTQWENRFLEHLLLRQGMKIKKIKTRSQGKNPEPANEILGRLNTLKTLKQYGKLKDAGKLDPQIAEAEQALQQLRGVL